MKKFWIKRDDETDYYLAARHKKIFEETDNAKDNDAVFCVDNFELFTGLKLKPGEIVQCELKVIKKG